MVPSSAQRGLRTADPGHVRQRRSGVAWFYVPDRTRPAYGAAKFQTSALRVTAQLNAKNKITRLWDEQTPCEGAGLTADSDACRHSKQDQIICAGASPTPACSPTSAPETGALRDVGQRIQQARWTSPQTNRLLFEAGFGTYMSRWGGEPMPGADPNSDPRDRPVHHGRRRGRTALRARDRQPDLPRDELGHCVGARGQLSWRRRRTSSAGIR